MPFGMSYLQSVQVQGTLYVGGGAAGVDNEYIVMTYDITAGKWATLPPYSTCYFAMTAIDNHLVLVGGEGHEGDSSEELGVWRAESKRWTHPYPDMTTPRSSCAAISYKEWLIVAGGNGDGGEILSSVEIMNTVTEQWYTAPPTPVAWEDMKTVIVDDTCYFMGGAVDDYYTNSVYCLSLPALVTSQRNSSTPIWKKLPQLPVKYAAPLSISGSLLAVGGVDKDGETVTALHLYQPDAGQWVKLADMPTPRFACTCIMTSDNELLVGGGYSAIHNDWLKAVDIACTDKLTEKDL